MTTLPSQPSDSPETTRATSIADPAPAGAAVDPSIPQKKPRKPDRRRALTRRAIIESATTLFAQRGVEATTVDEIAEAAELSVGTLYFHFGSKENVVLALVRAVLDSSEAYLVAARHVDSALERLLATGDVYFRFAIEQPVAFRLVSEGLPPLAADAPDHAVDAAQAIVTRVEEFVATVAADLQQAIDDGEIDPVPIDEGLAFVWGAWNGVAGLTHRDDQFAIDPSLGERALARGRSILVKGLGGAAPAARG